MQNTTTYHKGCNQNSPYHAPFNPDHAVLYEHQLLKFKCTKPLIWLAMSDKHEFKYYLNKNDRVETKNKKQLEAEADQKDKAEKDRIGEEKMQKTKDENKATQDKINERIRQNKLNK